MKHLFFLLLLTLLTFNIGVSQSTRRSKIKPTKSAAHTEVAVSVRDTVTNQDSIARLINMTGFKKPVASRVETIMLTNLSDSDTIHAVEVDIDYRTPDGQQLNRREVIFSVIIPPGETRHTSALSWDRQQLFYYIGTPPNKKTQRTTPFDIKITPLRLIRSMPKNNSGVVE